ncbi:low affinity immunoglobulin gamma Fc region receptor II-b-like isoform X2 [Alosa sapidissima]|uniref:low affinity immunoglobulin gamma Fc region receptor II-b-like isoform X2 n=1 Tax=Alosa sapidissima TaxID=34773 RepID=UPI001C0A645D|nr:low affinity immunoglobulin gamma Fc region receptor II-b-like isoform X2 [Alosa sapidissima]
MLVCLVNAVGLVAAILLCFSHASAQVSSVLLSANPGNELVVGETLILTCRVITDGSEAPQLAYGIWRDNIRVSTTTQIQGKTHSFLIEDVTTEQSGKYKCVVTLPQGEQRESEDVQVTVEDILLKPTLTVSPTDGRAYSEDTVLLRCGLHQHRGWKYLWYHGSRSAPPLGQIWDGGGGEAVFRLWRSALSDTGRYWCKAGRGSPTFYTEYSDSVYLNITNFFSRVTLSLSPGVVLKQNEPFRITCNAQVSERESLKPENSSRRAQVTFTFFRNGQPLLSSSARSVVTVNQARRCHSGRYSCTVASGRAQLSSPEIHVTTDVADTSLLMVILVGVALVIAVTLAAAFIHELLRRVVPSSMACLTRVMSETAGRESAYRCPAQAEPAAGISPGT